LGRRFFDAEVEFMHTQKVESQRLSDQYGGKVGELKLLQNKVVSVAVFLLSNVASYYGEW